MVEPVDPHSLVAASPTGSPAEQADLPGKAAGARGACPSCGRFLGPYARCPYCGADVEQRLPVRSLKYGSLLLAVTGLAVLLLVATRSEVPAIQIGDLVATMNWAYVRVEGLVSRQPVYDPPAADLTLWIWDGTGEIMVVAYRTEAGSLLARDPFPVMGDQVSLAGTLRIKEDFAYLVLNDPEQMEVRSVEPVAKCAAEVDAGLRYQKVRLRGVIRDMRAPYDGLQIANLWDASGEIDLVFPETAVTTRAEAPSLAVGQAVEAVGAVDLYRDTVQVSVGRPADLVLLQQELQIAPLREIGSLSVADVGRMVAVEGTLAEIDPFSAGVKWLLTDGSGTVTLLFWQDLYDALPLSGLSTVGAAVHAQGLVAEYRGNLEIVPKVVADVVIVAPAEHALTPAPSAIPPSPEAVASATTEPTRSSRPRPTEPPTPTPTSTPSPIPPPATFPQPSPSPSPPPTPIIETRAIGAISPADLGRTLRIELAGIADVSYLSKGVKYTLTDATGSIALMVWQDILEGTADRHDLLPGSQVHVTGRIDEYQGELEIVPRAGEDVTVLHRGGRLPVEEREVAQITPADQGRVFTLHGTLIHIEGRGWLRLWLDDGTGEMLVFLPARVVPYLPLGLGPGTKLQVTGQVEIYQSTLEIIPVAGVDVEVE